MRPTIDFKDDLGAVLRYHCTKVGISIAGYVKGLVYDDLLNKYPNLLDETKKETTIKQFLAEQWQFHTERMFKINIILLTVYHILNILSN